MENLRKAGRYLKRNGLKNTYYAVWERLLETKDVPYDYAPVSEKTLSDQRAVSRNSGITMSIVVPAYETNETYLREMVNSCLEQSYENWELVLADASLSDRVSRVMGEFEDARIKYVRLSENRGISDNTNEAIKHAAGEYVALLDHDDLLTRDALYEVILSITLAKTKGITPAFIYSDEDKCDGDGKTFYEPNIKPEFNFDYLLSNNYICHLTVIAREILDKYSFRREFDGAQDHDLFIRVTGDLLKNGEEKRILHIAKVLYHWRCHEASTAQNTDSKSYAYEAGKNCVESYTGVPVKHTLHKGFYRPEYGEELFIRRPDIGAVGGFICAKGKITGGMYDKSGNCLYINMNKHFSGYLHRAHCLQDAYALDIRNLTPVSALREAYAECLYGMQTELQKVKSKDTEERKLLYAKWSLEFAKTAHEKGFRLLFDPEYTKKNDYKESFPEDCVPVSVVIPNFNGLKYLKDCLDSVYGGEKRPLEVIVVDNASSDGSIEFIGENYPETILIKHTENLGFTGAVNHGIVRAAAPYIFLLNNDTVIESDCISKLYEAIRDKRDVFSAGALMVSMDRPELVDNAGDLYNLLGYPRSFATGKSKIDFYKNETKPVFTACAGAALYSRRILNEIGLFDDRHFAYFEDADIGYRARIFGYKNISVRNAVVYHKGSAVSGSKHNKFKVNLSSRNSVFLAMKNMPALQYICNLPFLLAGILIKTAFFTLKGLGGTYVRGTLKGFAGSFSGEGFKHHVDFKLRNSLNYLKIQLWIIRATLMGR